MHNRIYYIIVTLKLCGLKILFVLLLLSYNMFVREFIVVYPV